MQPVGLGEQLPAGWHRDPERCQAMSPPVSRTVMHLSSAFKAKSLPGDHHAL